MTAFDTAAVRTGDAAAAAGIPTTALLKSLDRGKIRLGPRDKGSDGSGEYRLLTLRRVFHTALFERLIRLGVRPSTAASISAMAAGEPGTPEPTGWLVRQPGRRAEVVESFPADQDGFAINLTRVMSSVREALAVRVPELRAAGVV